MSLNYVAVIAELTAERDRLTAPIDAAITALRALCPQEAIAPTPRAVVTRKQGKAATTSLKKVTRHRAAEAPDTPDTHNAPDTSHRVKGEPREIALAALKGGPGTVRELATRARLNGDAGYQSMWWALKGLVTAGVVVKHGTRYQLVKAEAA